jgi:DNA replication initiation complex subunit (GINS family)
MSTDNSQSQQIPLLTFNSIYNFLREEKKSKVLTNLPEQFYKSLKKYLNDKEDEIKKLKIGDNKEKLKKEKIILINSKKLLRELINLRSVKISNIAIKNFIFGEEVLDEANILEEELEYYNKVKVAIKSFYSGVLK